MGVLAEIEGGEPLRSYDTATTPAAEKNLDAICSGNGDRDLASGHFSRTTKGRRAFA
jgi:hypothetical protein